MKNTLIIFCLVLPAMASQAQNLTSEEAVRIALKNSMGIQLARNNVDIATIYNSYGIAGGLPFVAASASDQEQSPSIKQEYADPNNNRKSNNAFS
ncbi:MAG: TolC family protein, partial [Bacteroidetes bacterium]|nr:TolC family protein [Bacteroidota bacterium]